MANSLREYCVSSRLFFSRRNVQRAGTASNCTINNHGIWHVWSSIPLYNFIPFRRIFNVSLQLRSKQNKVLLGKVWNHFVNSKISLLDQFLPDSLPFLRKKLIRYSKDSKITNAKKKVCISLNRRSAINFLFWILCIKICKHAFSIFTFYFHWPSFHIETRDSGSYRPFLSTLK